MFVFEGLYFWEFSKGVLSGLFGLVSLPIGYFAIAAVVLGPLAAFHFSLDRKDERNRRFLVNLAFLLFYGFVFVISAFGIVWYGIAVYVAMFVAMTLALEKAVEDEGDSHGTFGFVTSVAVFGIVSAYLFHSAVPHAWTNLYKAGFEGFKAGKQTQEEAIFGSHPDYFPILAILNLKDPLEVVRVIVSNMPDERSRKTVANYVGSLEPTASGTVSEKMETVYDVLNQMSALQVGDIQGMSAEETKRMADSGKAARSALYEAVLYPTAEQRNRATVYRIGTFLTYFISENRKRYLDDSLVTEFDKYVYDANSEVTVERLKKLGVKYFLIDLNAATIDRDPRHALTGRFENLLRTFRSDKLSLVKTDSRCLQTAIRDPRITDEGDYLALAGVNYESYTASGIVSRRTKQAACVKYLGDVLTSTQIQRPEFSHLGDILKYLNEVKPKTRDDLDNAVSRTVDHGWVALFEVK